MAERIVDNQGILDKDSITTINDNGTNCTTYNIVVIYDRYI